MDVQPLICTSGAAFASFTQAAHLRGCCACAGIAKVARQIAASVAPRIGLDFVLRSPEARGRKLTSALWSGSNADCYYAPLDSGT